MSIPKKGSRALVVDGVPYRWHVRRKPTYFQGIAISGLTFAVERAEQAGATLVVETGEVRPDAWVDRSNFSITPGYVADSIRLAISRGWRPETPGETFTLWMHEITGPDVPVAPVS